ncbi:MAG TPA: FecR family protein [Rhodocyclaceae bacterium]|nr:FecR family protein [Rhodocyclaceae bacterium]
MSKTAGRCSMRWLVSLLAALSLGGCATITLEGVVLDGERVAAVHELGAVRIYRDGVLIDTSARMPLREGDVVVTGPDAFAAIRFASGSMAYLRPDSHARLGSLSELIGEAFARIRGAFAIQTTFVKAGAEGTEYAVRALPSGETVITVFEGAVQVSSPTAAWPALRLGAGQMTAMSPSTRPFAMTATPDELAQTRHWVEQMDRLVRPSPRTGERLAAGAVLAGVVAAILSAGSRDDDRDDRDDRPARLAAPSGTVPGSPAFERAQHLRACAPLWLSWSPVAGARDYLVTLDARHRRAPEAWRTVARPTTTATRIDAGGHMQPDYVYRWSVRGRDAARRSGPASAPLYFSCGTPGPVLR